jgi:hypothetical protein
MEEYESYRVQCVSLQKPEGANDVLATSENSDHHYRVTDETPVNRNFAKEALVKKRSCLFKQDNKAEMAMPKPTPEEVLSSYKVHMLLRKQYTELMTEKGDELWKTTIEAALLLKSLGIIPDAKPSWPVTEQTFTPLTLSGFVDSHISIEGKRKSMGNPFQKATDYFEFLDSPELLKAGSEVLNHSINNAAQAAFINVMNKAEMNSKKKQEEGRSRIISAVSGFDNILDRFAFQTWIEDVSRSCDRTKTHTFEWKGYKIRLRIFMNPDAGMGGKTYQCKYKEHEEILSGEHKGWILIDVGGDDYSVIDLTDISSKPVIKKNSGDFSLNDWLKRESQGEAERILMGDDKFVNERLHIFNHSMLQMPNGELEKSEGIFLTGHLLTYILNSLESVLKVLALLPSILVGEQTKAAATMGLKLTKVERGEYQSEPQAFMGALFHNEDCLRITPAGRAKHSWKYTVVLEENMHSYFTSMAYLYACDTVNYPVIRSKGKNHGLDVGPRRLWMPCFISGEGTPPDYPRVVVVPEVEEVVMKMMKNLTEGPALYPCSVCGVMYTAKGIVKRSLKDLKNGKTEGAKLTCHSCAKEKVEAKMLEEQTDMCCVSCPEGTFKPRDQFSASQRRKKNSRCKECVGDTQNREKTDKKALEKKLRYISELRENGQLKMILDLLESPPRPEEPKEDPNSNNNNK